MLLLSIFMILTNFFLGWSMLEVQIYAGHFAICEFVYYNLFLINRSVLTYKLTVFIPLQNITNVDQKLLIFQEKLSIATTQR